MDEFKEMIADCRAIIVHVERCKRPDYYHRVRNELTDRMGRLQRELDQLDRYHNNADAIIARTEARIEQLGELRRQAAAARQLKRLLELRDSMADLEAEEVNDES